MRMDKRVSVLRIIAKLWGIGLLFFTGLMLPAQAQESSLVADQIRYDARTGQLIAIGQVQVFYEDATLETTRLIYNTNSQSISLPQGFRIKQGNQVEVTGEDAQIDAAFNRAILQSAQATIAQSLRVSAQTAKLDPDGSEFETVVGAPLWMPM